MNRNLFTRIFLMSALCIAVVTGSVFVLRRKPVLAETKVVVDSTNFPDDAFRNYVLESYDFNLPYGILDEQEFENATSIWIMGDKNLKSLKGIELLTNVHTISVNDCNISSVDLSHNTNIESLYLENNNLKSLNVKPLSKLRDLFVTGNGITTLDLSGNPNIGRLGVSNTKISSIDISGLSKLTEFRCEDCTSLKTLDVSHNSNLSILCCNRCNLKTIKFGSHPDLFTLSCGQNELTSLDVSSFSKLQDLYFSDNKISTFKMGNHPELLCLLFENNKVSKIDVSSCSKLQRLEFRNNLITTVNVNNCPELTNFDARGNPLKSLSIDKCYKLKGLDCVDTDLNSLVCPPSETLYSLLAYPSKITKINISGCKLLVDAYKKGIKNVYIDYISYDISNGSDFGYFTYGKNVKIITNGTIEPTDTPTPTPTPVADISDNTSEITVDAGVKVRIDASVLGSKPYNWSSSDKTIATVDSNGYVTGKKAGTCTITVTKGTKKLICKVTVTGTVAPTAKPTSKPSGGAALTLDKKTISVVCGKTDSLKATLKGASGKITWKSSDTKIATVDANGKITTKQAGAVTITATAAGKSASCMVTVLYKDVTSTKDFWYAPTNYLTAKGVVKGYDKQTKFKPANDCTRAQMLTFMWRLQSEPAPKSSTCKFPDVKKTDYFYKPVIWAVEQGITTGYKDGTFKPQNVCTRAQTVTFLWRMAKTPKAGSSKNPFKDVKKSDYFYNAVLWASGKKIVAGYSDGTFKPQGKCLRRQMVTFLYKYDKFVNGKG